MINVGQSSGGEEGDGSVKKKSFLKPNLNDNESQGLWTDFCAPI